MSSGFKRLFSFVIMQLLLLMPVLVQASTVDRLQIANKQIALLDERARQMSQELTFIQFAREAPLSQEALEKAGKKLIDKANLDISVAKSTVDSLTIELSDTKQNLQWMQKNVDEANDQLNVLNIFGMRLVRNEMVNPADLKADIQYQQSLIALQKTRADKLQNLLSMANAMLQLKKDELTRINAALKSHRMLHIKQEEVKDELTYQVLQNQWLEQVNVLTAKLSHIDPAVNKDAYASLERDIFYANESANQAYLRSLIARYQDEVQQMKLMVLKSSSLSMLNETSDQVQTLSKQMTKVDGVLNSRIQVMNAHIQEMHSRAKVNVDIAQYLLRLQSLNVKYQASEDELNTLSASLTDFRQSLDGAIQGELSSRQGFPMFGVNNWLDVGHEVLIVPGLMLQMITSLTMQTFKAFLQLNSWGWILFGLGQGFLWSLFVYLRQRANALLGRVKSESAKINPKNLVLQWFYRNGRDLWFMSSMLGSFMYLNLPLQNYLFFAYLGCVWVLFKGISTLARLCLVETAYHAEGRDMTLFYRLRWLIVIGAIITGLTVFIIQLPLIYELKILLGRLFLMYMMVVSLLLLRYWDVLPNLIISYMDRRHPYMERSIRLLGVLLPLIMLFNATMGLIGYLNLVTTVSWYQGVFVLVLMGYLTLRGFLTDGMEQLSRLAIQYTNNGWLWTEAFLKPIDRVLRLVLFFASWAGLFLLYGWDKQSPIVERLIGLLHYQLAHVFNTAITPLNMMELAVVISVFYWTAKWTREFVYRLLSSRTHDMGIRNSLAILSQYSVIVLGAFFCLRVLGIDLRALAVVAGMFAFGVGLGLRDLANNFACGFLILLERPLRVGDIVNVGGIEGEVAHIGGRAVTVKTWDRMDLVVPNTEIFNKSFINWTARDNIVRSIVDVKISRYDDPHAVSLLILQVLADDASVLNEPRPEVYLREMDDHVMAFEVRYFVNIRSVPSRISVTSTVLMRIWDMFAKHNIKPPYPKQEVLIRSTSPQLDQLTLVQTPPTG